MTIKVLFALAAQYDLEIDQIVVFIVFLNSDIDQEIYVRFLIGFGTDLPPNSYYKLRKSLYGLKQSLRLW
jgi:hypothetical protein